MASRRPPSVKSLQSPPAFPMSAKTWEQVSQQLNLCRQQKRVVEGILRCQQDKQIAAQMGIAEITVQTYFKRACLQLGVRGRLELIIFIFSLAQAQSPD